MDTIHTINLFEIYFFYLIESKLFHKKILVIGFFRSINLINLNCIQNGLVIFAHLKSTFNEALCFN
jgi:hypothetical protein